MPISRAPNSLFFECFHEMFELIHLLKARNQTFFCC